MASFDRRNPGSVSADASEDLSHSATALVNNWKQQQLSPDYGKPPYRCPAKPPRPVNFDSRNVTMKYIGARTSGAYAIFYNTSVLEQVG